jgi:hypothetical protein
VVGVVVTVFFLQHDPTVKAYIARNIESFFADAFVCRMSCTVKRINFFYPSIELENVSVDSLPQQEGQWHWGCKRYINYFSWWNLVWHRALNLQVHIDNLSMESSMTHGQLAIAPHIQKLVETSTLPVALEIHSILLHKAKIHLYDTALHMDAGFTFHSQTKLMHDMLRTSVHITNGSMHIDTQAVIDAGTGTIIADMNHEGVLTVVPTINVCLPQLPGVQKECTITGRFQGNHGHFMLQNAARTITISPFTVNDIDKNAFISFGATIPLSYLAALVPLGASDVGGTCTLHMIAHIADPQKGVHGTLSIADMKYKQYTLAHSITVPFSWSNAWGKGSFQWQLHSNGAVEGSWDWDQKKQCARALISSGTSLEIPGLPAWSIAQQERMFWITYDPVQQIQGGYNFTLARNGDTSETNITGTITGDAHGIRTHTRIHDFIYDVCIPSYTFERPATMSCATEQKGPFFTLQVAREQATKRTCFDGTIYYPALAWLSATICSHELQGEGSVRLQGSFDNDNIARITIGLQEGNIRLAWTYNFMNALHATLEGDFNKKRVYLKDLYCGLHYGALTCKQATLLYDGSYKPCFIHIPCVLDNCLFNFQKDLFAVVSGMLCVSGNPYENPAIKGHVFLEKSQLKANLFSKEFQKKLFASGAQTIGGTPLHLTCDIGIETKDPIRVKTAFLETNAKVALTLTCNDTQPNIAGSIALHSGFLAFPYKPLYITKGEITFLPGQLHDPLIALTAKSKIKKYNIGMQVLGSAKNHEVRLESSPPLTEEQILGLLLVGSQEESLGLIMPALVLNNIKNLIFDSEHSPFKLDSYFRQILAPLRHVHLVPSFSDQTGRGGLRGAIEVDIGDRWRGIIQKNFSLTEDTRLELEYLLSDDVSVRAFRDERQDLGGEIEVRWKF